MRNNINSKEDLRRFLAGEGIEIVTTNNDDFMIRCIVPEHEDKNPSCGIRYDERDGKIKINCFKCGSQRPFEELRNRLKSKNYSFSNVERPKKPLRTIHGDVVSKRIENVGTSDSHVLEAMKQLKQWQSYASYIDAKNSNKKHPISESGYPLKEHQNPDFWLLYNAVYSKKDALLKKVTNIYKDASNHNVLTGFRFTGKEPFICLDFDHISDKKELPYLKFNDAGDLIEVTIPAIITTPLGKLKASDVVASYVEKSVSGNGYHVILELKDASIKEVIPNKRPDTTNNPYKDFEVFSQAGGNGVCVTGNSIAGVNIILEEAATAFRYQLPALPAKQFKLTCTGDSERLLYYSEGRIRLASDGTAKTICYFFNEGKWQNDSAEILSFAKAVADKIEDEEKFYTEPATRNEFISHYKQSHTSKGLFEAISGVFALRGGNINQSIFDSTDSYLINAKNGTINLKTGELQPFNAGDYLTKQLETSYNPNSDCSRWIDFITSCFEDETPERTAAMLEWLQCLFGAMLAGTCCQRNQLFCVFYGASGVGKTTLLKVLAGILGDDFTQSLPEEAVTKCKSMMKNSNPSSPLARIKGKRLAFIGDTNGEILLDDGAIKEITGGGKTLKREEYGRASSFYPQCLLVLCCNDYPRIEDAGGAMERRLKIIRFNNQLLDEKERNQNLAQELLENEREGILRWIVDGARKLIANNCKLPDEPQRMIDDAFEYWSQQDPVNHFLRSRFTRERGAITSCDEVFRLWQCYSKKNGIASYDSSESLGRKLKKIGFARTQVMRSGGRLYVYKGIKPRLETIQTDQQQQQKLEMLEQDNQLKQSKPTPEMEQRQLGSVSLAPIETPTDGAANG